MKVPVKDLPLYIPPGDMSAARSLWPRMILLNDEASEDNMTLRMRSGTAQDNRAYLPDPSPQPSQIGIDRLLTLIAVLSHVIPLIPKETESRIIRSNLEGNPTEPETRWRCHLRVYGSGAS